MASLQDVAKYAGVSVSTASKVLNTGLDVGRFSKACVQKVKRAAIELNYSPNYHAQSLTTGRASVLGLTMQTQPDRNLFEAKHFARLIGGVESGAREEGFELMMIVSTDEQFAVERGLAQVRQRRVDGLINPYWLAPKSHEQLVLDPNVRAVLVEFALPSVLPTVSVDGEAGITQVVQHLAELGHRRVLWLGPEEDDFLADATRREKAFAAAAWNADIRGKSLKVKREASLHRSGFISATQATLGAYMKSNTDFTAVACYNDAVASGAYRAILGAGKRVPHDISVVGFDDEDADLFYPELTTVNPQLGRVGRRAAEILLEMVSKGDARLRLRGHRELVVPKLIVRNSTAKAPS